MSRVRIADVQAVVADHYGITVADLVSHVRPRRVSRPRSVAFWLAERLTGQSFERIGRRFQKTRQAAHYGARRITRARARNRELRSELVGLEVEILAAAEQAKLGWSA